MALCCQVSAYSANPLPLADQGAPLYAQQLRIKARCSDGFVREKQEWWGGALRNAESRDNKNLSLCEEDSDEEHA
jgi:hypothetical protein